MFGILLISISSALGEISDSIGKKAVKEGSESYYAFGFLNLFFGTLFLAIYGFIKQDFVFSLASLPFFLPRLALEIVQAHVGIIAIVRADRSDMGFLKMLTIPLLLIVDIISGYVITPAQVGGIMLILAATLSLYSIEHFRTKGFWLICFTAMNAVATISLYKYDITHFNSVTAEQGIVCAVLSLYFFLLARIRSRENPLSFVQKPIQVFHTTASGLASAVSSFAFLFAPAVVITTAGRAFAILFSILSGRWYFHEKHMFGKSMLFLLVLTGLILLSLS